MTFKASNQKVKDRGYHFITGTLEHMHTVLYNLGNKKLQKTYFIHKERCQC